MSAIPFAVVGLIGATHGPRYDVVVMPSDDEATVRDADGLFKVVGKCLNAFAAQQWLDAMATAATRLRPAPPTRLRPAQMASRPCPWGSDIRSSSTTWPSMRTARAVIVSAFTALPGCRAKFVLDERALARLGYSC